MKSFKLHIENLYDETWIKKDLTYLENLILSSSDEELSSTISEESWFLWNEKGKLEEVILKDLYNLEANLKAYLFDVALCHRISILRALAKRPSIISLTQAFSLSSPEIMIKELIKPITGEILFQEPLKTFGQCRVNPFAKEAGSMNCICVKEHDEALYHWLKAREEGHLKNDHILIHCDAHSDMSLISSEDMNVLKTIKDIEKFKNYFASSYSSSGGDNLLTPIDLITFIHYAVESSLIREIFWVYPDPDYCKYRLPANLERYFILNIEGGENFRVENRHIVCDWQGIKVHILRLQDLPVFTEEVILDIDMDFFINQASADKKSGCRGYRLREREEIRLWRTYSPSLRFGDIIPWIRPENFISIIKGKNIFSSITTIALSSFFTDKKYHFLIDKLPEFMAGKDKIFKSNF